MGLGSSRAVGAQACMLTLFRCPLDSPDEVDFFSGCRHEIVNLGNVASFPTRLPGARPVPSTRDRESTTWVDCGQLADGLRAELGVVQLPPWPAVCTM